MIKCTTIGNFKPTTPAVRNGRNRNQSRVAVVADSGRAALGLTGQRPVTTQKTNKQTQTVTGAELAFPGALVAWRLANGCLGAPSTSFLPGESHRRPGARRSLAVRRSCCPRS